MPTPPTIVILAAGQGTRMRSALPKLLHPLCGRPLVQWPVRAALDAGAGRVVVVGGPDRVLADHVPAGVELAIQAAPLGTADALASAGAHLDTAGTVIVLAGDIPLVDAALLSELATSHGEGRSAATMATMLLDDPSQYGRVVRAPDGSVQRVVETKDPGTVAADVLAIREVNTGILAFAGPGLRELLEAIVPDPATGERFLPDALAVLRSRGERVAVHAVADSALTLGVNDRVDLSRVREVAQRRINDAHARAGVTIVDPSTTLIDVDVQIAPDATIEPSCFLRGATRVAAGARIGPLTTLIDSAVGEGASVVHSYLDRCRVGAQASVGPFAYLRPQAELAAGAKIGTFVEVKNSRIGAGAKVPHLSYIGDADVGERTNLGAGTITANYDGHAKHRTRIGDDVRGGVDTAFVAPVEIGDGAWTAAGSVVTEDVPAGALAIARARQRNVEDYARRDGPARAADAGPGPDPRGDA